MITVVDYGSVDVEGLEALLKKISVEYIVSGKEKDIINAEKIILPESNNILASIKRLHLLNLFSVLRMIKKPVLGIGAGMHLMTKSFKDINAACLGCFPVECERLSVPDEQVFEDYQLNIIKRTPLLKNIDADDRFRFKTGCVVPVNEFSTSAVKITGEITSSIEKENLYGVQFNPEKSGESGIKLIRNFINL